jgi:hypothetical protein
LALDHPYAGLVAVVGDAAESIGRDGAAEWFRGDVLPDLLASTPVDQCISWIPQPLLGDAPSDVPRAPESPTRFMHLYFLNERPDAVWDKTFANLGDRMRDAGVGEVVFASPFIPTIPGTDTYTDQLWKPLAERRLTCGPFAMIDGSLTTAGCGQSSVHGVHATIYGRSRTILANADRDSCVLSKA